MLTEICDGLSSPVWHAQLHVVAWYCDTMAGFVVWRSTCSCHGPEDPAAERDKCGRRGRRLPGTHDCAMPNRLQGARNEIRQWDAPDTGDDAELLRQAQSCARATFLLAPEKCGFHGLERHGSCMVTLSLLSYWCT